MGSRVEDLLSLARMLDEGKVSQQEYDIVKAELLAAPVDDWAFDGTEAKPAEMATPEENAVPDDEAPQADGVSAPLEFAATARIWIGRAKQLPAPVRWGAAVLLVMVLGLALLGGGEPPRVQAAGPPDTTSPARDTVAVGSLGVRLGEITAAWNGAGIPPEVRGAFTLTPEPGSFDTFLYRFDDAAVLAGAYDPGNDVVYALMLRAGLGHPAIGDLNSHVCHLLHPFDQDCLDALREATGVASISELEGTDHEATWVFEGNTWRLAIAGDVETLRVIAPGQP